MASTAVAAVSCPSGQYYDRDIGCQSCSLITNSYQEVICPCQASLDAVVGCKLGFKEGTLCRNRIIAIKKCANRGYTSLAPHTAASADSTTARRPTTSSERGFTTSGTLFTFITFETRPSAVPSTRAAEQLSSPFSVGSHYVSEGLVLALIAALLLSVLVLVSLYHCLKNRRQMQRLHANPEALPLAPLADPAENVPNRADGNEVAPNAHDLNDNHDVPAGIQHPLQDAEAFGAATYTNGRKANTMFNEGDSTPARE